MENATPPPLPTQAPPQSTAIGKHPCPECGGNLEWNARKQALVCPYCGTTADWQNAEAELGQSIVELDLEEALQNPAIASKNWGGARKEVKCQSCHAVSIFVDNRVAQRCDFCGSPAIVAHQDSGDTLTPQSILPFKVSDGQIRDLIRKWYRTRWFAPNRLKTAALTDTLHGIYLPYWTFDAHVDAHWRADAGYYYYETEHYRDSKGEQQTRQVRHTRWEPASGWLKHFFDDELVPGSNGVHQKLLREVEPFPTRTDLKPYSPEYVRGWTVERYQTDLPTAATQSRKQMDAKLEALCIEQIPGDTYRDLEISAHYQGRTFKHILVPVWLVSYTYGSKTFQIVANGYTGQIAGERPYSWIKISIASLLAILVLGIVVYLMR
ncbi:zinc ribbon domain-containing protein [Lysobacteraceae bacterium NML120232]|nr:zinc ribbon domain-containing protein [Xanthomonadaceae bacterium NML08-0793]PJK13805.1 zinc ribbon domain-containing protein [Xanthomonadaceae bacterium NML120232]